jgi:hypothetical protein
VAIACRIPPILNVLERDEILNLVRGGDFRSAGEKFKLAALYEISNRKFDTRF